MTRLTFSEEERQELRRLRFEYPHPRVQLRMEVLWLTSCGETYSSAARLAGVSDATVDRYVALYRKRGIEGIKEFDWQGPTSQMAAHRTSLEELFRFFWVSSGRTELSAFLEEGFLRHSRDVQSAPEKSSPPGLAL